MSSIEPALLIRNPCVANCCLDETDVCLGCHRTYAEILAWHKMSELEKVTLVDALIVRAIERKRN
ncbi:DUF1289 domain-containing protein [Shewanella donghaensis]|uniref:DUF1289 domain-containing protein n=1 Tax=Shewanella donghaensis TaxID=238836 RepID=UPI001D04E163|nr:DUF1289 domain-containing protein [Shewanella donghaensis]